MTDLSGATTGGVQATRGAAAPVPAKKAAPPAKKAATTTGTAPAKKAATTTGAVPAKKAAPTPTYFRDQNAPPTIDAGAGFAWAWNGSQWVRSSAAFRREQGGTDPASVIQNPTTPIGGNAAAGGGAGQMSEGSSRAIIRDFLTQIGLPDLEDLLYQNLIADQDYSPQRLAIEVRRTPQYAARFPGMAARQSAGASALTEAEYIAMERGYEDVMRRAGLPTGFYDSPEDFSQFIGGDISVAELSTRVQRGYQAVAQADPSVLASMRQFYGVTDGELAAYFLDPGRAESLILQQVSTAQIGAAAARQGFGQAADRSAAERMQRLGVTEQEAEQAFGTLARSRELLTPLDRGETALDVTETALGLTGRNAEAQQRLATQARRRTARFEGGGRFATSGQEVTGLRTT